MSAMIEFPPSAKPLPTNLTSPPYVIFGILNEDVSSRLPEDIPLALVLHYAPKLEKWILPPRPHAELPYKIACAAILKPRIGINITEPISIRALSYLVNRMLEKVGLFRQIDAYSIRPHLLMGCEIFHAWNTLELPSPGIEPLISHMLGRLMLGSAVDLLECQTIWHIFPSNSPVIRELVQNYQRGHDEFAYGMSEYGRIHKWISLDPDRMKAFGVVHQNTRVVLHRPLEGSSVMADGKLVGLGATGSMEKRTVGEILERNKTLKVTMGERKERHRRDSVSLQSRLSRLRTANSRLLGDQDHINPYSSKEVRSCGSSSAGSSQSIDAERKRLLTRSSYGSERISKAVDAVDLSEALKRFKMSEDQ
ncbi:hypothetical protein BU24DRAFT_481102 [Aaosphaeria arxii CBS 175.79]|uniref:Uncharacterized protein n=1 Tax=Aaosphaeria arxii CBS 175.79 TaxID=1450172 RepID=A0A6A5XTH0_9PLEO|nr:uncharacterized protein BU24DRAFT_481102 [Aaosphaeria arxii CBS 175.79]KAF2016482.1 hypothetical protein BU24DRAFT_481102 [Aaosphaeria arxii CBS 175.79]